MLTAALKYAELGWSVLPMRPADDPHKDGGTKVPYVKWKRYQTTRASEKTIRRWFNDQFPKAQIGIATGKVSGVAVLDFDSPDSLDAFRAQFELPDTISQTTGRKGGGFHYFFKYPSNGTPIRSKGDLLPDLDLRADGGLVVLAPSKHKSGNLYKWNIDPTEYGLEELHDMPPDIFELCTGQAPEPKKAPVKKRPLDPKPDKDPNWVDTALWGVGDGARDTTCTRLAGYYIRTMEEKEVLPLLLGWNMRNKPPMPDEQVAKCLKSIAEREGLEKLSTALGHSIYQVERLKYPDGDVLYKLFIRGRDDSVTLEPDELVSSMKFRKKLMVLTDKLLAPIKNPEWWVIIEKVLSEATEIRMTEDETQIGVVRRMILSDIAAEEYENPEAFIDNVAVVNKGKIHLLLDTLSRNLAFAGIRFKSQKELGAIIRMMGFVSKPARINSKLFRTWQMDYKSFQTSSQAIFEN